MGRGSGDGHNYFYSCTWDFQRFMPWLQHHGSHVTGFHCGMTWPEDETTVDKTVWTALPCSNLLELTLSDWEIQLSTLLQAATGVVIKAAWERL
jgi:hypothetical protein